MVCVYVRNKTQYKELQFQENNQRQSDVTKHDSYQQFATANMFLNIKEDF